MNSVDIFITCYQRQKITEQTINYLYERTKFPFRLFVINNGGNDLELYKDSIFLEIKPNHNIGIHSSWNLALAMAESEYFITSDNDIYVPDLRHTDNDPFYSDPIGITDYPCWLERMVKFMDERPDYGAISLCPHVFIGAAGIDPNDPEDVKERNMCGAVMRIMRKKAVWEAGGWENVIRTGRNHEERTICGRLQEKGWKTGIATRIRAFHPFPENWGYNIEFTPEQQGHNPALKDYVTSFGNMDAYDNRTWLPKL